MAILHTVNKSPFERNALTTCLRLAEKGSTILFIEDGVIAVTKGSKFSEVITDALVDYKFCFLNPDAEARGLESDDMINGVDSIDYAGFVDLVVDHDAVKAWL